MNRTFLFSSAAAFALAGAFAAPAYAITGPFSGSYHATKLILDDIAGRAEISVGGSDITVSITGEPDELATVQLVVEGGALKIRSTRHNRHWRDASEVALYKISVPKGTALAIDGMVGEIQAGDLGGDLAIDAGALKGSIGAVKSASLDGSGALTLEIGDIAGAFNLDASGAARIKTGNLDSADIDVSGAGDVNMQTIRHGLSAEIDGAGRVTAQSVNGPVQVEISGTGAVAVAGGRANPLKVDVSGMASFEFGGEAVDPEISVSGRGSVKLRSYTGKLRSEGGNITVGE
jgi:hypothetical protein